MHEGPVIIGFDGSEIAEHAIREAAAVLGPRHAVVVAVWESGIVYGAWTTPDIQAAPMDMQAAAIADQAMNEGAQRTAERGAELATQLGMTAEPLAVADEINVGGTLVRLAEERGAAAIVVGARRQGRVERMFLGSTSRKVLEHAPCAVLVVPPAEGGG